MDTIKYVIFCMIWGTDPELSKGAVIDTTVGIISYVLFIALFVVTFLIIDNRTNWKIPIKIICSLAILILFVILAFVMAFLCEIWFK